MWYLFIHMQIPYPFALKIICYAPPQGKWSMFIFIPLQFEMNEYVPDFLYRNLTWHGCHLCIYRFVYFASISLSLYIFNNNFCFWVEHDNIVQRRLPIFQHSFTYRFTLREIPRISDQLHPYVTLGMKNDRKVNITSSVIWE